MYKSISMADMLGIALLICLSNIHSMAQDAKQSFVISISSPSTTWKSTDSIRLDVAVKNLTDQRIQVSSSRSAWETGEILIRDGSGNVIPPIQNPQTVFRSSGSSIVVKPGKDYTESFNISKQFDLTKPGQYSLQIEKKDPSSNTVVKSNILVLTITP